MEALYNNVLQSYKDNQNIKILFKFRGLSSFNKAVSVFYPDSIPEKWLAKWTELQKKHSKGFIFVRKTRKNAIYGIILISKVGKRNLDSVLGMKFDEKNKHLLLNKFK
jgi:hypothetical protein